MIFNSKLKLFQTSSGLNGSAHFNYAKFLLMKLLKCGVKLQAISNRKRDVLYLFPTSFALHLTHEKGSSFWS